MEYRRKLITEESALPSQGCVVYVSHDRGESTDCGTEGKFVFGTLYVIVVGARFFPLWCCKSASMDIDRNKKGPWCVTRNHVHYRCYYIHLGRTTCEFRMLYV